jgi:hypothetical protein
MRYLIAILIKQGDIKHCLQLIVGIASDICFGSQGIEKRIALLPYPNGMRFNAG